MLRKIYTLVGLAIVFSFGLHASDRYDQVDHLFDAANVQLDDRNYDSSFSIANEALEVSKQVSHHWGIANSLYIQGWSRYKQNENSEALLLFLESLRVLQNHIPDSERTYSRAGLHMNIGRIYNVYSNFDGAHKFYSQGLEIAKKYNHDLLEVKFLYNDGVSYKYEGNLAMAAEKFIEAKHLALQKDIAKWYFYSINQLGLLNKDLERYDSARNHFDKALEIAKGLGDPNKYSSLVHHNIGVSYFLEKEYSMAEYSFLKSLELKETFRTQKDLTELYIETGRYDLAYGIGSMALIKYQNEDLTPDNATILKMMGNTAIALKEFEEGADLIEKYTVEINKYLETREYTKKLEDAYQIDLLTKQYFLKLEQQKRQAQIIQLSWFFGAVVLVFILLFFAQRWYQRRKKADATDAIKAIFNQSDILRGSLDREV